MDWGEIRKALLDRTLLQDEGERLMLMVQYAGTVNEAIGGQRVEVAQAEVVGNPWVALWADVCPAKDVDPRRALLHNASLAVGSICVDNDHYFIRHAAPLSGLNKEQLALMIDLVAHEAARLRNRRVLSPLAVSEDRTAAHYAE